MPTLFEFSELSLAAYASLTPSAPVNNSVNSEALLDAGFTTTKAEQFAVGYPTVIAQFNDALAEGGSGTSLSLTVFKDAANNLTLAIRGTNDVADLLNANTDIATRGCGYDQIVAMANWWRLVSATPGQSVTQHRLVTYASDSVPEGAVATAASGSDRSPRGWPRYASSTRAFLARGRLSLPNLWQGNCIWVQ